MNYSCKFAQNIDFLSLTDLSFSFDYWSTIFSRFCQVSFAKSKLRWKASKSESKRPGKAAKLSEVVWQSCGIKTFGKPSSHCWFVQVVHVIFARARLLSSRCWFTNERTKQEWFEECNKDLENTHMVFWNSKCSICGVFPEVAAKNSVFDEALR